jgi:hypothetical protein
MAVPTFHALYAAGFLGVAVPSSSPRPWPSSADPRLGSQLVSFRRGDHDAAGFASCCGPLACTFPHGRLDPALRRPGLPPRRRATTKVSWYLLWPDFHRLVIVSFQDARPAGLPRPGPRRYEVARYHIGAWSCAKLLPPRQASPGLPSTPHSLSRMSSANASTYCDYPCLLHQLRRERRFGAAVEVVDDEVRVHCSMPEMKKFHDRVSSRAYIGSRRSQRSRAIQHAVPR